MFYHGEQVCLDTEKGKFGSETCHAIERFLDKGSREIERDDAAEWEQVEWEGYKKEHPVWKDVDVVVPYGDVSMFDE